MAYETDSATSIDDLMTKLDAFLTGNGWTQDQLDTGANKAAWHKGTIYVSFRWDGSGNIGVYHALGFSGTGTDPGNHTGDSGNGLVSASITSQRRISGIGTGPFTAYHFFLDDDPVDCVHVVLEFSLGLYRHFSFGSMIKEGTWTGGEYATTLDWLTTGSNGSDILNATHHVMFDLIHANDNRNVGTLHIEGMPFQAGSSKWGVFWSSTSPGSDRAGNSRILVGGGFRDGPLHTLFCGIGATPSNGFVPMYPVWVFARNRSVTPEDDIFLGTIPNIRGLNIRYINPAEEFTYGSDVWMAFPWVRKSNAGGTTQESKYQGIAIKKVV